MWEVRETTNLFDELKSLDATSDIPLIAITNNGEVKNLLRILAKGIDEVIVAPMSRQTVETVAQKILQKHSGDDPVQLKLESARELIKCGKFEAALEIYGNFTAQGKPLLEAYLGLGDIYTRTKHWKDAELNLKKALELAKSANSKLDTHIKLAEVFFHYGNLYNRRSEFEKALKCYRTSVSLNPFHTDSIRELLELLQKCNEEDEAIKVIAEIR